VRIFEIFSDSVGDILESLRDDIVDYLMPLAAEGVAYVTVQNVLDKLRERQSGLEIDRALVMRVLDPKKVKLVTKIEGDRIYFRIPIPTDKKADDQKQKDQNHLSSTALKQARKDIRQ
jgi:hypothetical protein